MSESAPDQDQDSVTRNAPRARSRRKRAPPALFLNATRREEFQLRYPTDQEGVRELQAEAVRWSYRLRARRRWGAANPHDLSAEKAKAFLVGHFGIRDEHLRAVADAGFAEIDLPFTAESAQWELRILPWEFLIAWATSELRSGKPLTIVRRLRCAGRTPRARRARDAEPHKRVQLLLVESLPGELAEVYDLQPERRLIERIYAESTGGLQRLQNPTAEELGAGVRKHRPRIVHLAGIDTHQAVSLLDTDADRFEYDGYVVADRAGRPSPLGAAQLAARLIDPDAPADAVCLNLYNSAARIAPLCIAQGAGAAIGFQDSIDDALAELFFATLYHSLAQDRTTIVDAFRGAWQRVRAASKPLRGSGIVLWSAESAFDSRAPLGARRDSETRPFRRVAEPVPSEIPANLISLVTDRAGPRFGPRANDANVDARSIYEFVEVSVTPKRLLNYSMLHNDEPLFERFCLERKGTRLDAIHDLLVTVELHVGTDTYPFRQRFELSEGLLRLELSETVRISLASSLSRSVREGIRTSLFVEVRWRDETLLRETHRVTLLPVDEWCDTDRHRVWLPSFVLPRDPAVARIVDSAQRYLMALQDDAGAGFDGYQGIDPESATPAERCASVDLQVRALWSALLYESPLAYINPPPTFTGNSQRLRTPSDVLLGKRGTCIDLALLLAACLEYVEIHPAIVLLRTHAFPAYWRSEEYHADFGVGRGLGRGDDAAALRDPKVVEQEQPSMQQRRWHLDHTYYREVMREVRSGRLVPLESTLLTNHQGYAAAVEEGLRNLGSKREFESLLDIRLARTDERWPVTPLPIRNEEPR
jgi:hypothetical protein